MDQQDIQNKVEELPIEQLFIEEKEQTQQENEVNPEPQEEDSDEEGKYRGHGFGGDGEIPWEPLIDLIGDRALEAVKASRDVNATRTPAEHHAYFRAVFARMREEAAARDDIPNRVAAKPMRKLELFFVPHDYSGRCPCEFEDEHFPSVMVHANPDEPDGVTEDQVIAAICEELHPFPVSEAEQSPEQPSGGRESSAEPSGEHKEESSPLHSCGNDSNDKGPPDGYQSTGEFHPFVSNFSWMRFGGILLDGALFVFYLAADCLDEDFYENWGEEASDDDEEEEAKQDKEEEE